MWECNNSIFTYNYITSHDDIPLREREKERERERESPSAFSRDFYSDSR
jgi:hypothetical protein